MVADEVRKLAEENQTAAQSVVSVVGSMQDETGRAVTEIDDAVRIADGKVDEIARDAVEASAVAHRSGEATRDVGLVTSQTTASMQEVAASSGELARLAEELTATTARFTLARAGAASAAIDVTDRAA